MHEKQKGKTDNRQIDRQIDIQTGRRVQKRTAHARSGPWSV